MFNDFKKQILEDVLNSEQLFQKYFVDSETYFFSNIQKDMDLEYMFKKDISNVLRLHVNDIYIVGSGKTGFSMKPKAYGRTYDGEFEKTKLRKDRSDLDVAIISPALFDVIQETAYDWTVGYRETWDRNIYYDSGKKKFGVELKYMFLEYMGKGWYRPDFAPKDFSIETQEGVLKDVIGKWRAKLGRKVSYAIYKNWHFFKKYQLENIDNIRQKVSLGDLL